MQDVADVFAAWPSDAEFGRDIGVAYPTVSAWKQRGSIPAAYWWDIVRAAMRRGHSEITVDLLARLHSRKGNNGRSPGFAEPGVHAAIAGPFTPSQIEDTPQTTTTVGHFTRWKHMRRSNFTSREEISAHIGALREEWNRR